MTEEINKFDKASRSWDAEPRRVQLAHDVSSAIQSQVKLSLDMDVLDYGCGTGLITLALQPLVRSVTGVDSSQGMLDVLAEKIEDAGLLNVKTQIVDFSQGNWMEKKFDLIISSMVMHHIADVPALFQDFRSLLADGGMVALADLDFEGGRFHDDNTGVVHQGFQRENIVEMLAEAGFVEVKTTSAATIVKEKGEGREEFSVFLLTGRKA